MINYTIDLTTSADYVYSLSAMKQYDSESRTLSIRIQSEDGDYITNNSNYIYNFRALKPDGNVIYQRCNWSNNKILYTLDRQVLIKSGTVVADIEVKNGDTVVLSSQLMEIEVEKSAFTSSNLDSVSIVSAIGGVGAEVAAKALIITELAKKAESLKNTLDSITGAEEARKRAETVRTEGERSRANAESLRTTAERGRVNAEASRSGSETQRQQAEQDRRQHEEQRTTAENQRQEEERERGTAETQRQNAEQQRAEAERVRTNAEAQRASAESERQRAESQRLESERLRAETEQDRQRQESARVMAELARTRQAGTDHQTATQDHVRIESSIENIQRLEAGQLVTDVASLNAKVTAVTAKVDTFLAGNNDSDLDTVTELVQAIKKGGSSVKALTQQVSTKLDKTTHEQDKNALEALIGQRALKSELASGLAGKLNSSVFNEYQEQFNNRLNTSLRDKADITALRQYVEKENGKGLSSSDFTASEKSKLASIEANAKNTIIVNSLTSTSTTSALSAYQGKELKRLIDSKPNTPVINSLTSTSTTSALSAYQGKELKRLIDSKNGVDPITQRKIDQMAAILGVDGSSNAVTVSASEVQKLKQGDEAFISGFIHRRAGVGLALEKALDLTATALHDKQKIEDIIRDPASRVVLENYATRGVVSRIINSEAFKLKICGNLENLKLLAKEVPSSRLWGPLLRDFAPRNADRTNGHLAQAIYNAIPLGDWESSTENSIERKVKSSDIGKLVIIICFYKEYDSAWRGLELSTGDLYISNSITRRWPLEAQGRYSINVGAVKRVQTYYYSSEVQYLLYKEK